MRRPVERRHDRRSSRGPRRRHRHLPCLPAPRRLARGGGQDEGGPPSGLGILGTPGARLRRPARSPPPRRARSCGPRGQPHRPGLHGRQPGRLRRAALRGIASRRATPPSRARSAPTTSSGSKAPTSPRSTAVPRRPTGPRPKSAIVACRISDASCACSRMSASSWPSADSPGRRCCASSRSTVTGSSRRGASVTAQRRRWGHTVFSAATTPASRTPSPADSRQPCSMRSLRAPASWQGMPEADAQAFHLIMRRAHCDSAVTTGRRGRHFRR